MAERPGQRKRDDAVIEREIGATSGKTHEEVLDAVIGPERRRRNEQAGADADVDGEEG